MIFFSFLFKHFKYISQASIVFILYGFFWCLSIDKASSLGGWLLKKIGPLFKMHHYAKINLQMAFPEKDDADREIILKGMWDNLGRTLGEFPHITNIKKFFSQGRLEIINEEIGWKAFYSDAPVILFTGHLANWEAASLPVTMKNQAIHRIYRPSNNPYIDWLIQYTRRSIKGSMIPKGRKGAKQIIEKLRHKEMIGTLVDQKLNTGISIPFFNHNAPTASSVARLAYDYQAHLIGVQVERTKGAYFKITVHPPLTLPDLNNKSQNITTVMTHINSMLEDWIRKNPEQWLWIHRRWPKSYYQSFTKRKK